MPKKPKSENGETQQTEKGATIPVPKRQDVFRDLAKIAKPKRSTRRAGPKDQT
jgi:hypothetical protein